VADQFQRCFGYLSAKNRQNIFLLCNSDILFGHDVLLLLLLLKVNVKVRYLI